MTALIVIALVLYYIKAPKDKKHSDIIKIAALVYAAIIAFIVFCGFLFSGSGASILALAFFAFILYKAYKRGRFKSSPIDVKFTDYDEAMNYYGKTNANLPASQKARHKIIDEFNEKYNLYLTDEQISSIVNSSYLSQIWKCELEAMNKKFDNIYLWFNGPMIWLRTYMYVFMKQEITSDINQQERIVIQGFNKVFEYAETLGSVPMNEKIQKINSQFFCQFDDTTLAIANNYLREKGFIHNLDVADPIQMHSPVDDLEAKYTQIPQ